MCLPLLLPLGDHWHEVSLGRLDGKLSGHHEAEQVLSKGEGGTSLEEGCEKQLKCSLMVICCGYTRHLWPLKSWSSYYLWFVGFIFLVLYFFFGFSVGLRGRVRFRLFSGSSLTLILRAINIQTKVSNRVVCCLWDHGGIWGVANRYWARKKLYRGFFYGVQRWKWFQKLRSAWYTWK